MAETLITMKILNLLPQFLRVKLIRQNIHIIPPPEDFQVNIATTQEELEKAYSLLHDCYVGIKLMAPDESGLRCNFFSFLPNTTTVVAKIGQQVVGTVSLIKDSPVGLPSDKDFKFENDQLRLQGHKLVEVSSLAIDLQFRKKTHVVSLYLMKYLQHYTTHHMGCTTVSCVIHPRARDFYAAFWGFKSNKKIIEYKFVNGALGVHVYGKITDSELKPLESSFPQQESRNPIQFLYKPEPFLIYPPRKMENHLDPIYTPQLLKYFMSERTQAIKNLTPTEILTIFCAYSLFFDKLEELDFFKNHEVPNVKKRNFRFPTEIQAELKCGTHQYLGSIKDLTSDGAFFSTNMNLEVGKEYQMEFKLGLYQLSFPVVVRWESTQEQNQMLLGYGVHFTQSQLSIARMLKETHLTLAFKKAQ